MKTADLLKREHDAILDFLDVLESISRHMDSGGDVPGEDLSIILDFIVSFISGYHHVREESIVFPSAENAGVLKHNGPIGVLLSRHHTLQGYVRLMEDALMHEPFHREKFIKAAEDYTFKARSHIAEEIDEFFPLADKKMLPAAIEKLAMELEQFDITVYGVSRLDELYNIPVLLKGAYS